MPGPKINKLRKTLGVFTYPKVCQKGRNCVVTCAIYTMARDLHVSVSFIPQYNPLEEYA